MKVKNLIREFKIIEKYIPDCEIGFNDVAMYVTEFNEYDEPPKMRVPDKNVLNDAGWHIDEEFKVWKKFI